MIRAEKKMTSARWTEVIVSRPKGGAVMADFSADLTIYSVFHNPMSRLVKIIVNSGNFPFEQNNNLPDPPSSAFGATLPTPASGRGFLGEDVNVSRS
jgi:hypothetical protein